LVFILTYCTYFKKLVRDHEHAGRIRQASLKWNAGGGGESRFVELSLDLLPPQPSRTSSDSERRKKLKHGNYFYYVIKYFIFLLHLWNKVFSEYILDFTTKKIISS